MSKTYIIVKKGKQFFELVHFCWEVDLIGTVVALAQLRSGIRIDFRVAAHHCLVISESLGVRGHHDSIFVTIVRVVRCLGPEIMLGLGVELLFSWLSYLK
jgi:hypothetical protein